MPEYFHIKLQLYQLLCNAMMHIVSIAIYSLVMHCYITFIKPDVCNKFEAMWVKKNFTGPYHDITSANFYAKPLSGTFRLS